MSTEMKREKLAFQHIRGSDCLNGFAPNSPKQHKFVSALRFPSVCYSMSSAAEYSRDAALSGLIVYSPTREHRHVRKLCSWRGGNAHCRHRATRGQPGRDLLLPPLSNGLIALRLLGRVRPSNRRPRKFHQRLQPRCRKPHAVFLLCSFSVHARSSAFRSLFVIAILLLFRYFSYTTPRLYTCLRQRPAQMSKAG